MKVALQLAEIISKLLNYLIIIACIGLVVAIPATFIVPALRSSFPVIGVGITVVVFGGFVGVFIFAGKERVQTNHDDYLFTIGKVMGAKEGHIITNGFPSVLVEICYFTQEGKMEYTQIRKNMVYGAVEMLLATKYIMICYDPNDSRKVEPEYEEHTSQDLLKAKLYFMVKAKECSEHTAEIIESGVEKKGVILASNRSGEVGKQGVIWELRVTVEQSTTSRYEAICRQEILPEQEVNLQIGTIIKVYYLSHQEGKIVVGFRDEENNGGIIRWQTLLAKSV